MFQFGTRLWKEAIKIARPKFTAKISYDTKPVNPRLGQEYSHMICRHEKHNLGDKHNFKSEKELFEYLLQKANINPEKIGVDMDNIESSKENLLEELRKHLPILPLFLYDGKFPEMTTAQERRGTKGEFVGYIFMDEEQLEKLFGDAGEDKIKNGVWYLLEEADLYSNYISGNNFLYELFKDGEHFCAMSGFIGQMNSEMLHDMEMSAEDMLIGENVTAEEVTDMFGVDAPQIIEDKNVESVPNIESVEYEEMEM